MKELGRPLPDWGPAKMEDRKNTPYEDRDLDEFEPDFHNRITVLMETPYGSVISLRPVDTVSSNFHSEGGLSVLETYNCRTVEMRRARSAMLSTLTDNHGRPLRKTHVSRSFPQLDLDRNSTDRNTCTVNQNETMSHN